ncbi:restriction endonuclease [Haloarchaeobius sp. HRN-SO-5]|uniref:restriction endonuclease n=1 Tax=Haloarchaeobius sp. HRN-SO-5 TaxID=3446118 RepID=UPI003EBE7902
MVEISPSLVGQEQSITVDERVDEFHNLVKYRCQQLDAPFGGWSVYLTTPEDQVLSRGDQITGWIFDIDEERRTLTVTTHERGRADLHNLREEHREAASHIVELATLDSPTARDVDLDQVSHSKGLLTRCIKKDRWDWYTVFALLDKPTSGTLRHGQQTLSGLRTAAESDDDEAIQDRIDLLKQSDIANRFDGFVQALNQGEEFAAVDDEFLLKKLQRLEWDEFECFLADLWAERGWTVQLNEDDAGGGDVIARKPDLNLRVDIEAKQRSPGNRLHLGEVQRYASMASRKDTDKAMVVTTGSFTSPAWREAKRNNFILKDGQGLLEMIRSEGHYHIITEYID